MAKKTANEQKSAIDPSALSKSLSESAQQIWLAGVGALGRAQVEGSKLFDVLAKEGMSVENIDAVRNAVGSRVGQARVHAVDKWGQLEKLFESRVQHVLLKLGVPGRDELVALTKRVDALSAELRKTKSQPVAQKKTRAASKSTSVEIKAVRKPITKKSSHKSN